MFWCGYILIFTLPIIGSAKEFYAINSLASPNLTCYRDNQQFQPCGTFDILLSQLYYQSISRIYLLDRKLQISRNIHLKFSSHYKLEIKPWRNNSKSILACNSDFSITFNGIKEIIIHSIQFEECGKSNPLILINVGDLPVKLVEVINVTFIKSGQSSLQIISDINELQVIDSAFTGGLNNVDISANIVLKANFRSTTFNNNRIGSLRTHGSLNKSSLVIQNCTFSNNVVANISIQLYSLNSIEIVSSCFEENVANNLIQVENVMNISIVDSCFHSNVVYNGSLLNLRSGHSKASFYFLDNNFVSNNTAKDSDRGILSVNGLNTYISSCVFRKNIVNGSTLVIIESYLTVVNVTIFEENEALEGGALLGRSIQNLHLYRCNFTNNSADSGGALSISGEAIVIQKCHFNSNIAKEHGGALQVHAGMVNITESHWFNNTSLRGAGGAINITTNALHASSSKFFLNSAGNGGGAISMNKRHQGFFFFRDSLFEQNRADTGNGGALAINNFQKTATAAVLAPIEKFVVNSSTFISNSAALGNGGALHIQDVKLTTAIHESTFFSNMAENGGALSIIDNNVTVIYHSKFIQNQAVFSGGALYISGINFYNFNLNKAVFGGAVDMLSFAVFSVFGTNFTTNLANHGGAMTLHEPRMVQLWNCLFFNNTSEWRGGAVKVQKKYTELIYIANCIFKNNSAVERGGAIEFDAADPFLKIPYFCSDIFDRMNDKINTILHHNYSKNKSLPNKVDYFNLTIFTNCIFSHNTAKKKGGAISVLGKHSEYIPVIENSDYDRLVLVDCTLTGNSASNGGGVFCYSSIVFVRNALFHGNAAQYSGGGISLDWSKICFTGNISFTANKVYDEGQGGALYSNDDREACEENSCPVLWTYQSNLSFDKNVAEKGPTMFGGMLNRCNRLPEGSLETAFKRVEFDNALYIWDSYAISSLESTLCFNISCEKRKAYESICPGQHVAVTLACLDQLEQPLNNCIVNYYYESDECEYVHQEIFISGFHPVMYEFYPYTSLKFYTKLLCMESRWNELEVVLDYLPCPLGFYLSNDELKCICDSRLQNILRSVKCNIDNESIFVSSGWFSYKDNFLRIQSKCPLNYCKKQRNFTCPLQPDTQCANNRGGVLCGRCLANYSVVLGSWKCRKCSHTSSYNFTWLTVVMALAGVVLVVFLLLVKMTVSSGTINGLIFYSNIVSCSGLLDHQNCVIHSFLHVFISWINLDLGIEVCFYSGMDVYQKTWLQFVFPFYIWFLVGVIVLVCHYSSTVMKLMGMRNIEVLATLFLLSYAKLLKTIVTALSVTNIMVASADNITDPLRPHKVWVYDGSIDYFSSKHLPLFIVAVLFLFTLFMPYTLFLLCGQWLQYVPRKSGFRWINNTLISTIMDAYHAPYTKHHRYWTGLGLLIRCCLFTIFGISYSTGINLMCIIIAVITLQVIRIASSGKLYRNKVVDLLELFYLSNLGILATVLLLNEELCAAITISITLSFLVFVGILFYHLHLEIKKNDKNKLLYQRIKEKVNKICNFKKQTARGTTIDNALIPEQESSTSYFDFRESLIDSTV